MKWFSNLYIQNFTREHIHLLPEDFDWKQYILLNPDLEQAGIDKEQYAIEHYLSYGISEQRNYKLVAHQEPAEPTVPELFNPRIYKCIYPDLAHLTDTEAAQHFIEHGQKENRKYTLPFNFDKNFDPRLYKLYNADLANMSDMGAMNHYMQYGHKEGRTFYVGIQYDTLVGQKDQQTIDAKYKNCILLINHDISLTGAPLFLYDLYDYLIAHNYFTNIVIVEPFPNNILPDHPNKLYHFNDTEKLINIIETLDPVLIYSNSLNIYAKNLSFFYYWLYKTIFHFHEVYDHFSSFMGKQISIDNACIKVVSKKIKQEYLAHQKYTNMGIFPPFLSDKKLNFIDKNLSAYSIVKNDIRTIDKNKIIIGMSGSICDRKNFLLFYETAKRCPEHEFVWVGGKPSDISLYLAEHSQDAVDSMPDNFFWIQNTPNPYQYFNLFDYFFLTSKTDPCPIVVLENLYLNKKVIVLKNNIYTPHPVKKLENYINIYNSDDEPIDSIINKFKQIQLTKKPNKTNKNKEYILNNFNVPLLLKQVNKDPQSNYFVCSLYITNNTDISYYINLLNQFNIRNNYNYQCIISLSSDQKIDIKYTKLLNKHIINLSKIIYRPNIGYDLGGLLDCIKYIFTNNSIDDRSKLAYVHSKSNIHWKNITNKIFYIDNIDDSIDTIAPKRFTMPCKFNDLNRAIFVDHPDIFKDSIINCEFDYIQGTIFRTKTIYLKTLYDQYANISSQLTHINKNDIYWQSIMKNQDIFNDYLNKYQKNIFNNPIDPNSRTTVVNHNIKNYMELYAKFNMKGIPDCQIEHALERYIGFLITHNKKVYYNE